MVPLAVKTVALCSLMLLNVPVFPKDLGPACSSAILTSRPIKGCSDGGGNGGFSSPACSVSCMSFFMLASSFLPTPSPTFFMLFFFTSLSFADGLFFKLAFVFADCFSLMLFFNSLLPILFLLLLLALIWPNASSLLMEDSSFLLNHLLAADLTKVLFFISSLTFAFLITRLPNVSSNIFLL